MPSPAPEGKTNSTPNPEGAAPNAGATAMNAENPAAGAAPENGEPRRSPSELNQAQLRELSRAEQVCLAAQKAVYAPALTEIGVMPVTVAALLARIELTRKQSSLAAFCTTNKKTATKDEASSKDTLVQSLRGCRRRRGGCIATRSRRS